MTKMKTVYLGDLRCEAEHLDSGSKIRTVAKYREQLNIPIARLRKEL